MNDDPSEEAKPDLPRPPASYKRPMTLLPLLTILLLIGIIIRWIVQ